jgi:isocitrate dehydrogenase
MPEDTSSTRVHTVTLMPGDGIGPEIMHAVSRVLAAAGARITWEHVDAGAKVFAAGDASGVSREAMDSLSHTRVALKGPLETPVGFGGKSANVTLRKYFETFANIRPVKELPGIVTPFSGRGVDLVVVRENVEDLYAGIEHMQTPDVAQCLKLISRKGCDKIARTAFALAANEHRKQVHVATKANIMKQTEGMLKRICENVAPEYPEVELKHILIDNCAHQLVIRPEQFEVIVTTNMNGDIISDLTSGLVGGLGIAPSANLGHDCAIFEAVHGSAPDIAGQNKANPLAILLSSVMLLRHLGEVTCAYRVEQAIYQTLSHAKAFPGDIAKGRPVASTDAFTDAIIEKLDQLPASSSELPLPRAVALPKRTNTVTVFQPTSRETVGMDIFVEFDGSAEALGRQLEDIVTDTPFRLKMISNRGTLVYPPTGASTDCVNHWRCRFVFRQANPSDETGLFARLLQKIDATAVSWMHVEKLQRIDGEDAFSKAQGEN